MSASPGQGHSQALPCRLSEIIPEYLPLSLTIFMQELDFIPVFHQQVL